MSNRIIDLINILDAELDYKEYEMCRYYNDTSIDFRGAWEYSWYNAGFNLPQREDLRKPAYLNVIKSVIDALVSKLYNQKVRPYFTPVNGTWQTKRVVKNIQQFFDILYDNQKINKKISNAFMLACINGKGNIFINPLTNKIEVLADHMVATLQSEERADVVSQAVVRYLNYPSDKLKDYGLEIDENLGKYCTLAHYFNIEDHIQQVYINGVKVKEFEYKYDRLPILTLYYNDPVFGNTTTSIVRELDGLQSQVDMVTAKIAAATQLSDASRTFVFEGSNLTPKDLGNKEGRVYGVKVPAGVSTPPVVSVQDPPFNPFWLTLLQYYTKEAYEIVGISELSAMSKKPAGLDSGVALQTLEDIESDRFERQVTHYVQAFVDLARLIIDIMPENVDILPVSINNSSMKWKDVKRQSDLFKVQYSAATSFSKDPSEKQKQIINYNQIGLIPTSKIARYMDMPDMEEAFAGASAVADGVSACISNAIENEDYSIPEFVEYQELAREITVTENQLYSSLSGDKKNDALISESLERLLNLEAALLEKMEEVGFVNTEIQTEAPVQSEGGLTAGAPEQQIADITTQLETESEDQMSTPAENMTV